MRGQASSTRRLSIAELRAAACGRWPQILEAIGLPGSSLTKQSKPCPACGGTDRFSFTDNHGSGSFVCRAIERQGGDGFELVMHFLDCDLRGALGAVADALGGHACQRTQSAPVAPSPARDDGESLRRIWSEASPIRTGDPVWSYLETRGIRLDVVPRVLRYHPALPYWLTGGEHPVRLGAFPAMLAVVQGKEGRTVAIHRTYLQANGEKADLRDPATGERLPVKKLKTRCDGVMPGSAVRLFDPVDGRLVVTEGIETALAVRLVSGAAVWACVSASGLASVVLPPEVREVFVAGDNDGNHAGQRAAGVLAERVRKEGRTVEVLFPSTPGLDWLDVLNSERSTA